MTPERLRQIEELYHSARDREPGQRAAFLARACEDESRLGAAGMGEVLSRQGQATHRTVALKVLSQRLAEIPDLR